MAGLELSWDDLRALLAVARCGSTRRAAETLGLSQPTVARRVQALEQALGVTLAERVQTGYRLTPDGERAARLAEPVEAAATAFAAAFPGQGRRARGPLRVTSTEIFASAFVVPAVSVLRREDPDLSVELIATDQRLDLLRGEADLALRAGWRPRGGGLVAAKLPALGWGVYCSRSYRDAHGAPRTVAELPEHALILGGGQASQVPAFAWLEAAAGETPRISRTHSPGAAFTAIRAGLGVSMAISALGDDDPDLCLCFRPQEAFADEVRLVYPATLRGDERVRKLADAIKARFRAARHGRAPQGYGMASNERAP